MKMDCAIIGGGIVGSSVGIAPLRRQRVLKRCSKRDLSNIPEPCKCHWEVEGSRAVCEQEGIREGTTKIDSSDR